MESKISDLSFDFSLKIIGLYKLLIKNNEYVLSKQLLRSATSIFIIDRVYDKRSYKNCKDVATISFNTTLKT